MERKNKKENTGFVGEKLTRRVQRKG